MRQAKQINKPRFDQSERTFDGRLEKLFSELELPDIEKSYLNTYWLEQILSARTLGRRFLMIYYSLNIGIILASTLVTMLLIIGPSIGFRSNFLLVASILSVLVAVSAVLQQIFHFEARGRFYTRVADGLEEEFWQFFRLVGLYSQYHAHASAFSAFVERSTSIVRKTQRALVNDQINHIIEMDIQRETILQEYLDRMANLMLSDKNKQGINSDTELWNVARARTLVTLQRLDPVRKRILLQFLYELGLIPNSPIAGDTFLKEADLSGAELREIHLSQVSFRETNLSGADLSRADLSGADLSNANLSKADLSSADLSKADLSGADLSNANLSKANLSDADLGKANLSKADLSDADLSNVRLEKANLREANLGYTLVTKKQLAQAGLLQGAILPDELTHP